MTGGIQQVGIGVTNAGEAFDWYRKHFGTDVKMVDAAGSAALMTRYTGGEVHQRRAIVAVNLDGGGGLEIWQFTSREPQACSFEPELGDCGILAVKLKSRNVGAAYERMRAGGVKLFSSAIGYDPAGGPTFFLRDAYGNIFQVVGGREWLSGGGATIGGVEGVMIGVSELGRAKAFYGEVLGYTQAVYECEGGFADLAGLPGGDATVRRVRLRRGARERGPLTPLIGPSEIELIQAVGRTGRRIFERRYWGDLGFVHVCFDVTAMDEVLAHAAKHGFAATVDSGGAFEMGGAAARFSYVEDPDGTLIEFVELKRIPIIKKLGWYLNVGKRRGTPLPKWILKALAVHRVH